MKIMRRNTSPRYQRDNITSYLLVAETTCEAKGMSITLVEMEAGGKQHIHHHQPEQMYYILQGRGQMTVGDETQPVGPGDCIFIPTDTPHGLVNDGGTELKYLSACSPSFTRQQCLDWWPLPALEER
jgi:mannose-6-phosphate isomerase-like protein (cupin superfamily)